MRRAFTFSLGLALALGLVSGDALAKSRRKVPAAQGTVAQDPNAIPLPADLKTNKDWLDDGAGNPATGNLQPDAHNNDNYFIQQRGGYDPTWYTETGGLFDGRY